MKDKKEQKAYFLCVVVSIFRFTSSFTLHQKSNFWRPTDWSPSFNSTLPWCPVHRLLPLLIHPCTVRVSLHFSFQLYYLNPLTERILLSSSLISIVYCPFYPCYPATRRGESFFFFFFFSNFTTYIIAVSHHPLKYVIMEMIYYYLKVGKYVYYDFLWGDQAHIDLLRYRNYK